MKDMEWSLKREDINQIAAGKCYIIIETAKNNKV